MKRFVVYALVALLMLGCLTACQPIMAPETTPAPTPDFTPAPITPDAPAQTQEPAQSEAPVETEQVTEPGAEATPEASAEVTPEATPEPTPEPTPAPANNIGANSSKSIKITKQPYGEYVYAGHNVYFTARATGSSSIEWRFVSPDKTREIVWNADDIATQFPGLRVEKGNTEMLLLYNVPAELNGWSAVCLFTDADGGKLASNGAKITVLRGHPAAPSAKPSATPSTTPSATPSTTPSNPTTSTTPTEPTANPSAPVVTTAPSNPPTPSEPSANPSAPV